jgi:putative intracellular protease/amidase
MKKLTLALVVPALMAASSWANAANILVVLSDSNSLQLRDGKTHATGFYLNELMQPVKMMLDSGDTVTFVTPEGKAPTMDKLSADAKDFGGSQKELDIHLQLLNKLQLTDPQKSPVISLSRVEQIGYQHFDALFVPGGHAPMQDLSVSPELGKLLRAFHKAGKPTALVCHGPVALISALPEADDFTQKLTANSSTTAAGWIYAGYRMTSFSNPEEEQSKAIFNGGIMKFTPQDALVGAGAKFEMAPLWQSHVVVDRELITGQNPASAIAVGKRLLSMLAKESK